MGLYTQNATLYSSPFSSSPLHTQKLLLPLNYQSLCPQLNSTGTLPLPPLALFEQQLQLRALGLKFQALPWVVRTSQIPHWVPPLPFSLFHWGWTHSRFPSPPPPV